MVYNVSTQTNNLPHRRTWFETEVANEMKGKKTFCRFLAHNKVDSFSFSLSLTDSPSESTCKEEHLLFDTLALATIFRTLLDEWQINCNLINWWLTTAHTPNGEWRTCFFVALHLNCVLWFIFWDKCFVFSLSLVSAKGAFTALLLLRI